jgi:cell wall assembly regulator SMI1
MPGKAKERGLDSLLKELEPVLNEIAQLSAKPLQYKPYGPASEAAIAAAEKRLKFKFPSSYREFLRLHNGWDGFNAGDICVLGVSEAAYKKAIGQWNADLAMFEKSFRRRGKTYVQELREKSVDDPEVIYVPDQVPFATDYNGDWWVFDSNRKSTDGEYEIARVAHGEDVEDREQGFRAYVENNLHRCHAKLRKLRGA